MSHKPFSKASLLVVLGTLGTVGLMPTCAWSASTSANSSVTIIAPVTLTKTADLVFGTVAPTTSAGTVVMSAAGTRTGTNVVLSSLAAGNAAGFTISGNANSTFAVTLPTSTSLTGPGTAMTVNAFTSTPSGTGTLSAGGTANLAIGATLAVGVSQTAGAYTGTFSVTVDYN